MEPPFPASLPTIHLNGTSASNLEAEYAAVRLAIGQAIQSLGRATCNARDFYPQGPGAYEKALAERGQAFENLSKAAEYAEAWEFHAHDHLRERQPKAS